MQTSLQLFGSPCKHLQRELLFIREDNFCRSSLQLQLALTTISSTTHLAEARKATMSALLLNQLPPSPLVTNSTPPSSPTVQTRSKMTLPLSGALSSLSLPATCPLSKKPSSLCTKNANGAASCEKADKKSKPAARRGKLGPGCSLLDWIRLCRSKKDLGCNGGKPRPVTEEELAQHNTPDDAWTAIRGMHRAWRRGHAQYLMHYFICIYLQGRCTTLLPI